MITTETLNILKKLNDRQAFDFITDKPPTFLEELNQFEKYSFSVYSADLWEYEPQAQTDEFITYLVYTYKNKWQDIYKNDLQNFGTNISISQNTNKEDNNNYIQTNDGVKATLSGEEKTKTAQSRAGLLPLLRCRSCGNAADPAQRQAGQYASHLGIDELRFRDIFLVSGQRPAPRLLR